MNAGMDWGFITSTPCALKVVLEGLKLVASALSDSADSTKKTKAFILMFMILPCLRLACWCLRIAPVCSLKEASGSLRQVLRS